VTGQLVFPLALPPEGGPARICILVAVLVDTTILVYRFDHRYPDKQRRATALLREGIQTERLRLPHQAIMEFVAAVTRPSAGGRSLLTSEEACREAEELLAQFPILYPTEGVLRSALRGAAAYHLSWFDVHLWAYADHYGLEEIVSEDFQHDRLYGSVRIRNPFV
jgi:predicted nucleic acid-binding protein